MPDEDNCACGLKYKTGGQLVAAVQMVLGLLVLIKGFFMLDYLYSNYDRVTKSGRWISWWVVIVGCVCMTAASSLLYGVQKTRPNGLMVYVVLAGCGTIKYFIDVVRVICYGWGAGYVILFFGVAIWYCFTVVFVYRYRRIMIMQLTRARVIFPTPHVSRGHYPGAPAQVVIDPGVQPGVYPAPYNPAPPGAYPGNMNPSYPYPSGFSQPPPYSGAAPPPPGPQRADALPPKSSFDTLANTS